jgi:hypothetical protein
VGRDWNLINEGGTQPLDGAYRRAVIRIAGDDHGLVEGLNKWGNGVAGLARIPVATEGFEDLESDVAGAEPDVIRAADPKINVAGIGAIVGYYAEVVCRHELTRRNSGYQTDKPQFYLMGG